MGFVGDLINGHNAHKDAKAANKIQQANLDFNLKRYEDWKGIYGETQEDLSTYFKNISGRQLATQEVQSIQSAHQSYMEQMDSAMAQRGIDGGGLHAGMVNSNIYSNELAKNQAFANGDAKAAQMKMGFVNAGQGMEQSAANGVGRAYNAQTQTYMQGAGQERAAWGKAFDSAASMAGATFGMPGAGSVPWKSF